MRLRSRRRAAAVKAARTGLVAYGAVKRRQGRRRAKRASRSPASLIAAAGSGAALAYLADPQAGRRRRHVARDRTLALVRRGRREAVRRSDYAAGVVAGAAHEAVDVVTGRDGEPADDVTLTRQVESAIARAAHELKSRICVNTEGGVVYLRGELHDEDEIATVVAAARRVKGAQRVESLLHGHGTPAPMKH